MLLESGLSAQRPDVSKEKARDKVAQMLKSFKETRALADQTGWGVYPTKHEVVAENTRGITIKEVLIKKCPFYYELEEIMEDLPTITPPYIMESERPGTAEGKEDAEDTEVENIDEEDYEKRARDGDSDMNRQLSDAGHWLEDDISKSKTDLVKRAKEKYALRNKKVTPDSGTEQITPTPGRGHRKRPLEIDSDSDDTRSKVITKRGFRREEVRSVVDALVEVQIMKSNDFSKNFEFEQIQLRKRFDAETSQRDQHHKEICLKQEEMIAISRMQHEEKMMRLQIELEKTQKKW